MSKKQLFCLLSGLSLSLSTLISLPLYAQTSIKTGVAKPKAKTGIVRPKVKTQAAKPAVKTEVAKPTAAADVAKPKTTAEATAASPNLEVTFKELRDSTGQVCLSLYSGPKGFPKGGTDSDLLSSKCTPIANGVATLMFGDLKPGKYAITAFHDANNDGKMNKNSFGMPEEGFGFSNNPEIGFSAPSFGETEFPVSETKAVVPIKLRYLN
jgi:uncharacterized protein (DUF2141 family)